MDADLSRCLLRSSQFQRPIASRNSTLNFQLSTLNLLRRLQRKHNIRRARVQRPLHHPTSVPRACLSPMSGGAYRQRGLLVLHSIPSRSSVPVPARQHRTAFHCYPEPVPAVLGLPLRARLVPLSIRTFVFLSSRPLIRRASRAQGRHERNISASQQFCWMPPGTSAFRKLARVARKLKRFAFNKR